VGDARGKAPTVELAGARIPDFPSPGGAWAGGPGGGWRQEKLKTNLSIIGVMMRARNAALILLGVLFAASAAAQSKGNSRINGKILDDQGKPAQAVMVRAVKAGDPPVEVKTNDKGEWTLNGLATGEWNLEFVKEGFDPQRMTVQIVANRNPPIDMKLTRTTAPTVDPNAELKTAMQQAVELQKAGKLVDARKVIEDLIAKYPEAYRLNAFIASTYEGEKNIDKAIEHMKIVVDKEPNDLELKMYLAELYTAKGSKADAQALLESVDMTQVKDPTLFINMAIGAINEGKSEDAVAMLDKLNKQFPAQSNILYYRARAYIVGKKLPEAKADLEKFVASATPDARELPDAKKLLEQLKDVK
jgi:Flp pilus assembly protein TadD